MTSIGASARKMDFVDFVYTFRTPCIYSDDDERRTAELT